MEATPSDEISNMKEAMSVHRASAHSIISQYKLVSRRCAGVSFAIGRGLLLWVNLDDFKLILKKKMMCIIT